MSFSLTINSLSAVVPVKFSYSGTKEIELDAEKREGQGGLAFYAHKAFENLQDTALSKKNALFLTDVKSLNSIFKTKPDINFVGDIAGCIILRQSSSQKHIISKDDGLFLADDPGFEKRIKFHVVPVSNKTIELHLDDKTKLIVDKEYPYTLRLSQEILKDSEITRQRFEIDYKSPFITLKTLTKEGYRYLSAGSDFQLRAVGVMLNQTVLNDYLFNVEFVSKNVITRGVNFDATSVKYHNDLIVDTEKPSLIVKEHNVANTNLLVSCPTTKMSSVSGESSVPINITMLKTNFTPSGTFNYIK